MKKNDENNMCISALRQNEELRGVVVTRLLEEMFNLVGLPMLPPPPQLVLAMPRPNDILPSR